MGFQKGNQLGKANAGSQHGPKRIITRLLMSRLTDKAKIQKRTKDGELRFDTMGRPIYQTLTMTNIEKIVDNVIQAAVEGDKSMILDLIDRVDGKAIQAVELGDPDGKPLQPPSVVFNFNGSTDDDENPPPKTIEHA